MSTTINIDERLVLLNKLRETIEYYEQDIYNALENDLKKCEFESFATEYNYVLSEIKYIIKKLSNWAKPKRVTSSLINFPSKEYIYFEPYGKVLIIAPWNYPFQLCFSPLIAAIAAGNTVVVKPSEHAFETAQIVSKIIQETFDVKIAVVVQGGVAMTTSLLEKKWDYIFFTGSVSVGKIVAQAAVKNLTPYTLELGGKNPCIVDENVDFETACKRIIWGKFTNAGQTCIAPDYILVHKKAKETFIKNCKKIIVSFYGEDPILSKDFGRIINKEHFYRLTNFLNNANIIFGGTTSENELFIAPTLIDNPALESAIMQDEIFGPILPILTFENEEEIAQIIHKYQKPLSLYVFSENEDFAERMITQFSFGGGCINDTLIQFVNKKLPFGGVGMSGIGYYHGKFGFLTFSHQKAIVKKTFWFDIAIKYPPFKNKYKSLIKKITHL